MIDKVMFYPVLAMAALTFGVCFRMYAMRIGQMKRERIHPQSVATSAQAAARLTDSRAADNFRNLFELPVLFYVVMVLLAISGWATPTALTLAWAFVGLRVLHSVIQCTYNKVMHRFSVHVAGALVLGALWAYLGVGLLRA